MIRKKILWLCSWYPNKIEPFNGDFIQRHARAASLYDDIYVIHVAADAFKTASKDEKVINKAEGLIEHFVYYKRGFAFLGKIISYYRWFIVFRKAIRFYLKENGKPDLVHVHIPVKAGLLALWMKKKYKVPYVLTEHWGIYNNVEVNNYENKSTLFKNYTKKIINGAARFISVSSYLAEGVNRLVMKKKYTVIPNTVDTSLFYFNEKHSSTFRFIHVSNMVPVKNTEGILKAFKLLLQQKNNASLIMVGDTDPAIRKFANELGISVTNISFLGEVSYKQVAEELKQSQCLVLFSNIENSPCVICEALCCGLPVIATNVGGIPELVDAENSILVELGNERNLANAMQKMMESYSGYDGKKIAEDATNKFSYSVIGKKIDTVYREVTGI